SLRRLDNGRVWFVREPQDPDGTVRGQMIEHFVDERVEPPSVCRIRGLGQRRIDAERFGKMHERDDIAGKTRTAVSDAALQVAAADPLVEPDRLADDIDIT